MLKQAFRQDKELQEEVVLLFNIFSNRLDELIDSSNNKDVISCRQKRNVTIPQLPATEKNRVAGHSGMEEGTAGWNKVASHSEMERGIKGVNSDLSDVRFFIKE